MLRNVLKDGRVSLSALSAQAPDLLRNLAPVFVLSPLVVPTVIPADYRFDAVVILGCRVHFTSVRASRTGSSRAGSGVR